MKLQIHIKDIRSIGIQKPSELSKIYERVREEVSKGNLPNEKKKTQ